MSWLSKQKFVKKCSNYFTTFWRNSLAEDWIFLALLGFIAALIGYFMDYLVWQCFSSRMWLFKTAADAHLALQYLAWIALPCIFLLTSFSFVNYIAPQAVGSGIPEMKTILWGIQLREYLTFKTGVAKVVGLTAALGSGVPLGKEGPLVHIASVIAMLVSKLPIHVTDFYSEESKANEMLAAACAVGLAINFASPVGGVLFSIEVTSSYFPSHNYWRGFVAAIFASLTNRLLVYWLKNEDALTAAYQTAFREEYPFLPEELIVYLLIGIVGGLAGAGFVLIHRKYSLFLKRNKLISSFLKLNRFIYPTVMVLVMATLYFPPVLGKNLMATYTPRQQIFALFANFSWYETNLTDYQNEQIAGWKVRDNYFITLSIFMAVTYILSIIATTLPVPNGSLIPIFRIGAAFGRMVGEAMRILFPNGMLQGSVKFVPGGYALVGAAAFTAGVTHSISISVVVCEMTGHIGHIIPVMIAVLMSSAISCLLGPSYFDSLIIIKDLPYLPNIRTSRLVGDFMVKDVKYVYKGMTYQRLNELMDENQRVKVFPLVDNPESMILLGSITKSELLKLIKKQISNEKRLSELERLHHEAKFKSFEVSMESSATSKHSKRRVTITFPNKQLDQLNLSASNIEVIPIFSVSQQKADVKSILKPQKKPRKKSVESVNGTDNNETNQLIIEHHRERTGSFLLKATTHLNLQKLIPRRKSSSMSVDMTMDERVRWEQKEMSKPIDLSDCKIDAAPFQLVEQTSLIKVHTIFSLLGMKHAYVTSLGKLIGVFALREMRKAVETVKSNSPNFAGRAQINKKFTSSLRDSISRLSFRKRCEFHGRRISSPGLKKRNSSPDARHDPPEETDVTIVITPPDGVEEHQA